MTSFPYSREIDLAIIKTAGKVQLSDLDDFRQEVRLALLSADVVLNERLAYSIARKTVIDILRKSHPMDDIDDPAVLRKSEPVHFPDEETRLDSLLAVEHLRKLPFPYKIILELLFGIDGEEYTEEEVAEVFNKSQVWVARQKARGLSLLRGIME